MDRSRIRKIGWLLAGVLFGSGVWGQRERVLMQPYADQKVLFWGIQLGVNRMTMRVEPSPEGGLIGAEYNVEATGSFGVSAAAIGGVNLNRYVSFRIEPGIAISGTKLRWIDPDLPADNRSRNLQTYYFDLPLVFKINTLRLNNVRPYLTAGGGLMYNFTSKEKSGQDNSEKVFRLRSVVYYWEAGIGVDFYLPYFKFSPAVKYVRGINNLLVRDHAPDSPWTGPIGKISPSGVFLTFTFE